MADQKHRLVMDIVKLPTTVVPPAKLHSDVPRLQMLLSAVRNSLRLIMSLSLIAIIIAAVVSLSWFRSATTHHTIAENEFPATTLERIKGFKPYYFNPGFKTNFVLQRNTVSYHLGVLLFVLKSPSGKVLTFTEEATPSGYDFSGLRADKQFTNAYGQAFITDGPIRTTGELFTDDHTWILANAPQAVGADLMQQMLNSLAPMNR